MSFDTKQFTLNAWTQAVKQSNERKDNAPVKNSSDRAYNEYVNQLDALVAATAAANAEYKKHNSVHM